MNHSMKLLGMLGAVVCTALAQAAFAANYYVDYAGGADGQTGDSAAAAFQHCPGDAAAKEKAAAVKLQPGDTVVFKGGGGLSRGDRGAAVWG